MVNYKNSINRHLFEQGVLCLAQASDRVNHISRIANEFYDASENEWFEEAYDFLSPEELDIPESSKMVLEIARDDYETVKKQFQDLVKSVEDKKSTLGTGLAALNPRLEQTLCSQH